VNIPGDYVFFVSITALLIGAAEPNQTLTNKQTKCENEHVNFNCHNLKL
jgi:hypothetical protein